MFVIYAQGELHTEMTWESDAVMKPGRWLTVRQ